MPDNTDKASGRRQRLRGIAKEIRQHHAARRLKKKAQARSKVVPIREQGIIDL